MVVAFSGHRPEKLPWGNREEDPRCLALKAKLAQAVEQATRDGADTFLCGMARGCDFYFGEAVLSLKNRGFPLRLEAYLPCPSQASRWPREDQNRYQGLLSQCDGVILVEHRYSDGCMLRRNRKMVEQCDLLLTVWDGTGGGTAGTVAYAKNLGKPVWGLWL